MKYLAIILFAFTVNSFAQVASTENLTPTPTEKIFRSTDVDLKPQLEAGMYTLSMFISDNFKFPKAIKNKKITIFSSFVIENDGTMSDIKAFYISVKNYIASDDDKVKSPDEKINEIDQIDTMKAETVRVLRLFNKTWKPALKEGKAVRCLYNYPINFNIE